MQDLIQELPEVCWIRLRLADNTLAARMLGMGFRLRQPEMLMMVLLTAVHEV